MKITAVVRTNTRLETAWISIELSLHTALEVKKINNHNPDMKLGDLIQRVDGWTSFTSPVKD